MLKVSNKIMPFLASHVFYNWKDGAFKLQAVRPYDRVKGTGNGKTPGSL